MREPQPRAGGLGSHGASPDDVRDSMMCTLVWGVRFGRAGPAQVGFLRPLDLTFRD